MNRLILFAPLALLAACSDELAQNDVTQNNAQATEPLSLPDPVEPARTPSATVSAVIPEAFRGEWSAKAADCGKGSNDSRLEIAPGELRFYESSGTVTQVSGAGREITVTARYTGEGETWTGTRSFVLAEDGETLTSEGMTRVRCP